MNKIYLLCALGLIGAARVATGADAPTITIDKISDYRSNSQFGFGNLSIYLGLKGQTPDQSRAKRAVATSVTDNTGQQLVTDEERYQSDWHVSDEADSTFSREESEKILREFPSLRNFANIEFEVKSPARAAQSLREVVGYVEFYYPQRDPKAVVTISNIGRNSGQNLDNATLKAANLKLAFLSANQVKRLPKGKDKANVWLSTLGQEYLDDLEPDQLLVSLEDPRARLVSIEVETAQGQIIEGDGSFSSDGLTTYDFEKPILSNARLKIYVATPKSVETVPFKLSDVPLP